MYSVEFTRDAAKALSRMPRDLQRLVLSKIEGVATDPHAAHNNVKRLQGRPEMRLRVHDWRVLYRVHDDRLVVLVVRVASRGEVYE